MPQAYYEEPVEAAVVGSNFSHGKTILVLAIVVGCFAVLWPKIFYPMLFGSQPDRQEDPIAASHRHIPPGGPSPGGMPGSEFLHPAMRERGKMGGMGVMPEMGARPPIRTVDKEWGGRGGPMPGMRPTMGGPGIQAQQPRGSGTMGVIMPIYTVGIIIFFVYTTMKILFKNKDNEEEEEDEYTKKRKREMKLRQDEESEYARYAQNFNKLNKRPQEFLEKDRKSYILDKEVGSPHARIEEINQMVNNLKQETLKQISSAEVIPLGCAKTLMDPAPLAPDTNAIKPSANDPHKHDTDASNEDTEGLNAQNNDAITSQEVKDGQNKSGMINQKEDTEIIEASQDPRDLEINLLKKRLEETEKAMERIMTQMGSVTQQLLPQAVTHQLLPHTLETPLLSHPTIQNNCEMFQLQCTDDDEIEDDLSTNQEYMENDMTETSDDTDSNNDTDANENNNNQLLE